MSVDDVRATAAGNYTASSTVAAGDADIGTALILFRKDEELFNDQSWDQLYSAGEGIYSDADKGKTVTAGDIRLTSVGVSARALWLQQEIRTNGRR